MREERKRTKHKAKSKVPKLNAQLKMNKKKLASEFPSKPSKKSSLAAIGLIRSGVAFRPRIGL